MTRYRERDGVTGVRGVVGELKRDQDVCPKGQETLTRFGVGHAPRPMMSST